jgi:hypothetical protein
MEDCRICFSVVSIFKWKKLSCNHNLCYSCYLKLNQPACPYCRTEFTYTQEDLANREKRKIRYTPYTPPAQLTDINSLDHGFINLENINTNNTNDYHGNEIIRNNRKMFRRRRRNLSQEEIAERRKNIRARCKRKWQYRENRLNKIKWYDL